MDNAEYTTQCVIHKKTDKNYKIMKYSYISRKSDSSSHQKYEFPVFSFDGSIIDFHRNDQFIPMWNMDDGDASTAITKSRSLYQTQSAETTGIENVKVVEESPDAQVDTTTKFTTEPLTADVPVSHTFEADLSDWGVNHISEIKQYLAKPQRYGTFAWAATNVLNDQIMTIANTFHVPSVINPWLEKLKGYYGLRSTLCFSFQINATPFVAGRLRAAYYPGGDNNARKASIHFTHAIPFSQLPGVEIECSKPSATLKIPYITEILAYELTGNSTSWGRLDLRVVAPMRTDAGNAQTLNVVVWTWMEDVELIGQTNPTIVTQSASIKKSKKVPSEQELPPFTSFFTKVNKAANNLSSIPILSAYMAPVQWASQAAAGICSAFGWSKPLSTEIQQRFQLSNAVYSATATGTDSSHPLSVLADAKLRPIDDASLDGVDETSLNFIKTRWSFLSNFTWATTNVAGDILKTQNLSPFSDLKVQVSTTEIYHTPVGFLGVLFQLYRGGLEFKLKIAKTNFHKGQLCIIYQPGPSGVPTIDTSTYMYRENIDLSDVDEVTFKVPYLQPLEYLETGTSYGRLDFMVFNPLLGTESVASTIDLTLYVRGCDNLEFVQPRNPILTPYVTQSVDMLQDQKIKDLGYIGGSPSQLYKTDNAERCTSELVLSLTQLLKRYVYFDLTSGVWRTAGRYRINFYPWIFSAYSATASPDISNYQSTLVSPFAFFRGSARIMAYENVTGVVTNNYSPTYQAMLNSGQFGQSVYSDNIAMSNMNIAVTVADKVNGSFSVQFPYQGPNRITPIYYQTLSTDTTGYNNPRGILQMSVTDNTKITRSFGDDFQLMFFVGVPRLAIHNNF